MNFAKRQLTPMPHRQQGVALIMALVFLVILTIMGLAAMGTTSLEEKMAGNAKDRNLAFQAAETGLLAGENWINAQINKPTFPTVSAGLYLPTAPCTPVWADACLTWSGTSNLVVYPNTPTATASGGLTKINTQPKYIIEDLGEVPEKGGSKVLPTNYKGKGNTIVRTTARGTGGTDAAQAMVQSTYSRAF